MKNYRIARRTRDGELFEEVSQAMWSRKLEAWKKDQSLPCPMPVGHSIFNYPASHGMEILEVQTFDTVCLECGRISHQDR
jgi:hypothetical protein